MTVQNPAIFIQSESHPAEDVRRWMSSLVDDSEGVQGYTDLAVSEKSGTPDMSVDVAGGRCFIQGTEGTYQGVYFCENRGTTNLAVSAADATYERHDLVVAKVQDSAYSGATDAWSLAVVTGTPAASPADPTAPANSITLARINVTASASSITDAMIDDLREQVDPETVPVVTSSTRPLTPAEGRLIVETDTNKLQVYDGSSWLPFPYGATGSYSPTWTQTGSLSTTSNAGTYFQYGKLVTAWGKVVFSGTGGTAGTAVSAGLPVTAAISGDRFIGTAWLYSSAAGGNPYLGGLVHLASTTTMTFRSGGLNAGGAIGAATFWTGAAPVSGDAIWWQIMYEAA